MAVAEAISSEVVTAGSSVAGVEAAFSLRAATAYLQGAAGSSLGVDEMAVASSSAAGEEAAAAAGAAF
jgi:hypothetical protein